MTISILRSELRRVYAAVKLLVARGSVAVLQHVLLRADHDGVTLEATNLTEHLQGAVEAVPVQGGAMLVPVQTLKDLSKGRADDRLVLEGTEAGELSVASDVAGQRIVQRVTSLPVAEWPEMPVVRSALEPMDLQALLGSYSRVLPAVSQDPTRYALHGVFADPEAGMLVATDGRRMFLTPAPVQGWPAAIWPKTRVLTGDLLKSQDGGMVVEAREGQPALLAVEGNGWRYTAQCIEAKYPAYRNVVLPAERFSRRLDLASESTLIRQAIQGFGLERKNEVYLHVAESGVHLADVSNEAVRTVVLLETHLEGDLGDGEQVLVGWRVDSLLDSLAAGYSRLHLQSDDGEHKPARFGEPDGEGCAIVMPWRPTNEARRLLLAHFASAEHAEVSEVDAEATVPAVASAELEPVHNDTTIPNQEETPPMPKEDTPAKPATEPHKPDLRMVEPPEPVDPIAELDTLVGEALEAVKETRERLLAVKTQLRLVKADHRQKERETRSTQILLDKLKNAAGF